MRLREITNRVPWVNLLSLLPLLNNHALNVGKEKGTMKIFQPNQGYNSPSVKKMIVGLIDYIVVFGLVP